MKRLITLSIIMSSAFGAYAQDVEGRVTLDEVTVKAAKVVNKADGMIIYPTDVQKRYSNNGYSILRNCRLPICVSTTSTTRLRLSTIGEKFSSESMVS